MDLIVDSLRQEFMPKRDYNKLREEDKVWTRLQRPLLTATVSLLSLAVIVSVTVSLAIVFPADGSNRPFCRDWWAQPFVNVTWNFGDESIYITVQEASDYYLMVVLVPSSIIFLASVTYLLAGITVACSAPARHGCLRVVENNCCASKRGGVRCLSILNIIFAAIFSLLALFLGLSLLFLGSSCSLPLFWCYEIASWGLAILYGGTAFLLKRNATIILDKDNFSGRDLGLEMLEASPQEMTENVEMHGNEGFKS